MDAACSDLEPPPVFRVPPPPLPPFPQSEAGCDLTWEETCHLLQVLHSGYGLPLIVVVVLCVSAFLIVAGGAAATVIYFYKYRRKRQRRRSGAGEYRGVAAEVPLNNQRQLVLGANADHYSNPGGAEKPPLFLCYASEELELFHPEYQALPIATPVDSAIYSDAEKDTGKATTDVQQT
ncbi:uncharacterized protein LOC126187995 [Schistocerca cancellata]|uniref:uncharacterized protein LOC126187995 n=1 Tax=Schistocerca cancellata TaxID=274614 RepID=UPI002117A8EC|nr:uncharacterized protein LOC126187995 [Schistocerca cancellata]